MPCRMYSAIGTFVFLLSALSFSFCSSVMYTVVEIFFRDMEITIRSHTPIVNGKLAPMTRPTLLLLFALVISGCAPAGKSGGTSPGKSGGSARGSARAVKTVVPGEAREDRNRDGKPDVWIAKSAGGTSTQTIDLDYDGDVDLTREYDADGKVRVEARDLDYDGRIDFVTRFEKGLPVLQETGFGFDGAFHQKTFFEAGRRVREEVDIDQDGKVDEWRWFEDEKLVRVGEDKDRDGQPETFRR